MSSIAFEIPKKLKDFPPTYDESIRDGPFEEKPVDNCSFQVNLEGEPNEEIFTEIDCKTGKPKMIYVKKMCSHCGSKFKPVINEGSLYSRLEKFVSYMICFAGIMALLYFFIDMV